MSNEALSRDQLPTFEVIADVVPEDIVATLEQAPQARLLELLWGMTHWPSPTQVSDHLMRIIQSSHSDQWDDQDEERIIVKQEPNTLQEEEYLRLTNLRGSLDFLGWRCLEASSLPDDKKAKFAAIEDEHLGNKALDDALGSLNEWARANPEEAARPITITSGVREQAGRLSEKIQDLADFYNQKQPIIAAYKIVYPDGYRQPAPFSDEYWEKRIGLSKYDDDMHRYSVFGAIFDLLGAEEQAAKLVDSIGAKEVEVR